MSTYIDDTELIVALQHKESAAGFKIFDRYVRRLTWFVEKITENTQAAQDIATESFLKTFDRAGDFATLAKLEAFLFTVAHHAALNWLEAEKRRVQRLNNYPPTTGETEADRNFLLSDAVDAIHEIINGLPKQVRQVVTLSLLKGKKLDEIASEMNISYKTVQHHKAKGFRILRERLNDKGIRYAALFALMAPESWN